MKTKSLAGLVLTLGLLLSSCGEGGNNATAYDGPKDALLILIDKTISSEPKEERQTTFTQYATDAVVKTLKHPGDCVRGHFIHENTTGSTAFLRSQEIPPYQAPERGGGKSKKIALQKHQSRLNAIQGHCNKELKSGLTKVNFNETRLQTDLWGILEVASYFFNESPFQSKHLLIFSDLEESMPGDDRRDFYEAPIQSKSQAESFAKADANIIRKQFNIDEEVLAGTQVTVVKPFDPMEESNFKMNWYYWEALLREFGIEELESL